MADEPKQSNWLLAALHSFLDDREVEKQNKANEYYKDMFKNAAEVSPHYMGHGGRGGRGMLTQDATGGGVTPGLVQAVGGTAPFVPGPGGEASTPVVRREYADPNTGLIGWDTETEIPKFKRNPAPYIDPRVKTNFVEQTPQGPRIREDMPIEPMPVVKRVPLTPDEEERMAALMRSQDPYAPVPPVEQTTPLMPMSPYVPPGAAPLLRTPTKFSSGG